jgi:hypothetical protein
MSATLDDCYVVFIRDERQSGAVPALMERELVTCSTYHEAECVRRECGSRSRKCIIRFVGPTGGGD